MTFRDRLRRIPLLAWIAGPVALAALVAWPLGGWDTVTVASRILPSYASNETVRAHQFEYRVDDAWLTDDHPAGYGAPDEGERYFILRVEATNLTDDPAYANELDDYIVPEPAFFAEERLNPTIVLVRDGTPTPELNPGVDRLVEFVWTIPDGAIADGDRVRLFLRDAVPRDARLYYGTAWDTFDIGVADRGVSER